MQAAARTNVPVYAATDALARASRVRCRAAGAGRATALSRSGFFSRDYGTRSNTRLSLLVAIENTYRFIPCPSTVDSNNNALLHLLETFDQSVRSEGTSTAIGSVHCRVRCQA